MDEGWSRADNPNDWKRGQNWAECKSCKLQWYWSNQAEHPGKCDECGSWDIDYHKSLLQHFFSWLDK